MKEEVKTLNEMLIGFCNVFTPGLQLGLYDFDSTTFRWLDFANLGERIIGIKDIVCEEDGYSFLTLMQDHTTGIAKLDRNLNFQKYYGFSKTFDAHSFIILDDGYLVTNTGGNSINKIQLLNDSLKETEYWTYCDRDSHVHINSIMSIKDDVFVSMFGPKLVASWDFAKKGKIINISKNEEICKDLSHPHSLTNVNGKLYWLESATGLLYHYSENHGCETIIKLDGYLRGMTHDEKNFYIASTTTNDNSNVHSASYLDGMESWIHRVDRNSLENEKQRLTVFGPIRTMMLASNQVYQKIEKTEDPIMQKISAYEDEYLKLQKLMYEIMQERDHLDKKVKAILNSKSWKMTSPLRWFLK
jgi:hypothetical protein